MTIVILTSCHPILSAPCKINNGEGMPLEIKEKTKIMWNKEDPYEALERPKLVIEKLEKLGYLCWGRSGNNVCRMWMLSKGDVKNAINNPQPKENWFIAPEDLPEDDVDCSPQEMQDIINKRNYLLKLQKRAQNILKTPKQPNSGSTVTKQNIVVKTEPQDLNQLKTNSQKYLRKNPVVVKQEKNVIPSKKSKVQKKKKGRKFVYVEKIKALSISNNKDNLYSNVDINYSAKNSAANVKQPMNNFSIENSKGKRNKKKSRHLYQEKIKVLSLANKNDSFNSKLNKVDSVKDSDANVKQPEKDVNMISNVQIKTEVVESDNKVDNIFQRLSNKPRTSSLILNESRQSSQAGISTNCPKSATKTTPLKKKSQTKKVCEKPKNNNNKKVTYADKIEKLKTQLPTTTTGSPQVIREIKKEPGLEEQPGANVCGTSSMPVVKQEPNYYGYHHSMFSHITFDNIKVETPIPPTNILPSNTPPKTTRYAKILPAKAQSINTQYVKILPANTPSTNSPYTKILPANTQSPSRPKRSRRKDNNPEFKEPGAYKPDWTKMEPYTTKQIAKDGIAIEKKRRGSTKHAISYLEISDDDEED